MTHRPLTVAAWAGAAAMASEMPSGKTTETPSPSRTRATSTAGALVVEAATASPAATVRKAATSSCSGAWRRASKAPATRPVSIAPKNSAMAVTAVSRSRPTTSRR